MECVSVAMAGFYNMRIKSSSSFFFQSRYGNPGAFFLTLLHFYTYPCLVPTNLLHVYT